jgi:hypothetical protein
MSPACKRVEFCSDGEVGYEASRTRFVPGEGLALDETYRLAHLPLVARHHPDVIPRRDGTFYEWGRHPRVFSLVMPVSWKELSASKSFRALEADLRSCSFAPKIDWALIDKRGDRLHATICGSLAIGSTEPPTITQQQRQALLEIGPIHVELRGLFSGNVNVGRLYLRAYPERRDGENVIQRVQRALGRKQTNLYLVGLYNFADHLIAEEASELKRLIDRWWGQLILRLEVRSFWLLWSMDDLVLDASVAELIPLFPEAA